MLPDLNIPQRLSKRSPRASEMCDSLVARDTVDVSTISG